MVPNTLEEILERERPRTRGAKAARLVSLLLPFVASAALLGLLDLLYGFAYARAVFGYALLSFFVLGKFLILKGIAAGGFGPFELALLVFWMDLAIAFLLTFNLDYVYRFPYLGKRLEGLQEHGRNVLEERPWLRKVTFLGIVLFVMFPLTGTGAIGGSIFGRLLGLDRIRTFSGVFVGSALGCFGIAALAEGIGGIVPASVRESVWFEAIGLGLLVVLIGFLWLRSRRIEREWRVRRAARDGGPAATTDREV